MWHSPALLVVLVMASCSPDGDVTGATAQCAGEAIPSYNPKSLDQCIAACRKCDGGTRASCSTSCTFKGAR
jgi:hypothetical protein